MINYFSSLSLFFKFQICITYQDSINAIYNEHRSELKVLVLIENYENWLIIMRRNAERVCPGNARLMLRKYVS